MNELQEFKDLLDKNRRFFGSMEETYHAFRPNYRKIPLPSRYTSFLRKIQIEREQKIIAYLHG